MIQQIISHTPTYVWALLAFLIYRGVLASQDREISLQKLAIIPAVMLALSLSSIDQHGILGEGVWAVWMVGVVVSVAITWQLGKGRDIAVNRSAGTVLQRGSWMPLALMIAIFCTKYMVAIVSAMHPEVHTQAMFVVSVTALYGLFNGIFIGRLLRYVAAYLRQSGPVVA
jgi:hypothetical protein